MTFCKHHKSYKFALSNHKFCTTICKLCYYLYNFCSPKAHTIYLQENYLESRKIQRKGQRLKTNLQAPNNSIRMVFFSPHPKNPPSEPKKSILRTWTFFPPLWFFDDVSFLALLLVYICCRVVRPNKEGAFTPRKIIMSRESWYLLWWWYT